MTPILRDSTTIGRYRIEVWQELSRFRVEVHELDDGQRWRLVRGPFGFPSLEAALRFSWDVAAGLRERMRLEA